VPVPRRSTRASMGDACGATATGSVEAAAVRCAGSRLPAGTAGREGAAAVARCAAVDPAVVGAQLTSIGRHGPTMGLPGRTPIACATVGLIWVRRSRRWYCLL